MSCYIIGCNFSDVITAYVMSSGAKVVSSLLHVFSLLPIFDLILHLAHEGHCQEHAHQLATNQHHLHWLNIANRQLEKSQ